MDIFSVITLLGGLALFLYGMNVMSDGLEKLAGSKLEQILRQMTSNPLKALFLGVVVTGVVQSSSAVTVILVGLVNSGIMQLSQSVGVIMGSNIGTTVTAWLLSLIGIESNNVFLNLLKPKNFSLLFAFIGILLIMMSKSQKKKDVGSILTGFAVLMMGMELMSGAVEPLKEMPGFQQVLTYFSNPFLGVLVGAIFTAVIQSSSASVGILQALSMTGGITYGIAIPIIMGQNIGTCVTSLISSIGVNKSAKKVAVVHISFNIIGTLMFLVVYCIASWIFHIPFLEEVIGPSGIAIAHTIFNVVSTIILFPFSKQLEKLANLLVKEKKNEEQEYAFLDERLIATPAFAIAECRNMTSKMAERTRDTLLGAVEAVKNYDKKTAEKVIENENELDMYEDKLGTYLVKLASKDLSENDAHVTSLLLHTISDFERIGDHAVSLVKAAQEMHGKKITFSEDAKAEMNVLMDAVSEILIATTAAFTVSDLRLAGKVEPLEQVIDQISGRIRKRHIDRLTKGQCTIELGFILNDILNDFQRVSDHCSNIAVALIEVSQNAFDTHEYLGSVKTMDNEDFKENFTEYQLKFELPARK